MKTVKFTGEMDASFGTAGSFKPGQEAVTLDNTLADSLIAKGYFVEVKEEPKKALKTVETTI